MGGKEERKELTQERLSCASSLHVKYALTYCIITMHVVSRTYIIYNVCVYVYALCVCVIFYTVFLTHITNFDDTFIEPTVILY